MKKYQPETQGYAGHVKAPADQMPVRVETSAFMRIGLKFTQEFAGSERGSTAIRTGGIGSLNLLQIPSRLRNFTGANRSMLITSRCDGNPASEFSLSSFNHERVLGRDVFYAAPRNEYAREWISNRNSLAVEENAGSLKQDVNSEDSCDGHDEYTKEIVSRVSDADVRKCDHENVTQDCICDNARSPKSMLICATTNQLAEFGVSHE